MSTRLRANKDLNAIGFDLVCAAIQFPLRRIKVEYDGGNIEDDLFGHVHAHLLYIHRPLKSGERELFDDWFRRNRLKYETDEGEQLPRYGRLVYADHKPAEALARYVTRHQATPDMSDEEIETLHLQLTGLQLLRRLGGFQRWMRQYQRKTGPRYDTGRYQTQLVPGDLEGNNQRKLEAATLAARDALADDDPNDEVLLEREVALHLRRGRVTEQATLEPKATLIRAPTGSGAKFLAVRGSRTDRRDAKPDVPVPSQGAAVGGVLACQQSIQTWAITQCTPISAAMLERTSIVSSSLQDWRILLTMRAPYTTRASPIAVSILKLSAPSQTQPAVLGA